MRHSGELVGLEPHSLTVVSSSPTSSSGIRAEPEIPLLWKCPKSGTVRARVQVFDRVSWSDTPTFHNTLVVGSSPTSSTTRSCATREFVSLALGARLIEGNPSSLHPCGHLQRRRWFWCRRDAVAVPCAQERLRYVPGTRL